MSHDTNSEDHNPLDSALRHEYIGPTCDVLVPNQYTLLLGELMSQIRFTMFFMLALSFLPGQLAAQGHNGGDSGQYVILSAQYGHERRHVDVTNRLKELARADRVFRASNDVFGVDPDPGAVKTLRIYARGPNGQEQMFEYREGSVVDGTQFRGWRGGNWGGGWSGNWH